MMRALYSVLLAAALATLSCSGPGKSTTCCEEACRIWESCWSYQACMSACAAEGDWCGSYIECIRGKSCQELQVCE